VYGEIIDVRSLPPGVSQADNPSHDHAVNPRDKHDTLRPRDLVKQLTVRNAHTAKATDANIQERGFIVPRGPLDYYFSSHDINIFFTRGD
jgi:hypothetical protein